MSENKKDYHLDASESAFFAKQLEFVKSKVYETNFPELLARMLFPVNFEGGNGIDSITYHMMDRRGMAKVISNYADDLPRADVFGKEFTAKVKELGSSYGFNVKEIRKAMYAKTDLRSQKAKAAKMSILELEDKIAFNGDTTHNIQGFINHPNINTVSIPADGTGSSALWTAKTADLILRDMNLVANKASEATNGVEKSDTLLLPVEQYNLIATKTTSTNIEKTVLKFFLENNPYIKQVIPVPQMNAAGTASADVIMAYKKDPMKLELAIPSDFEQLPEEKRNLEYIINCLESFAGIMIYYPLSITKGEGI